MSKFNQKGAIPLLLIIAVLGLVAFFIVASTFNFKNSLFSSLFPKPGSFASEPVETSPPVINLVKNPGCELDIANWIANGGAGIIRSTAQFHSGKASCKVNSNNNLANYSMVDYPDSVTSPKFSQVYNAQAWVKTNTNSTVGKLFKLRIRQVGGIKANSNTDTGAIALSTSWQIASVSAVVDSSDRKSLGVSLRVLNGNTTDSFFADDISLVASVTQSNDRNTRRQSDIQTIANALEAHRQPNLNYPTIFSSWFAGGVVPSEGPTYIPRYSIIYSTTQGSAVAKPTVWLNAAATPNSIGATTSIGIPASGNVPVVPYYSFQVCAQLENGVNPANIYCIPSHQ